MHREKNTYRAIDPKGRNQKEVLVPGLDGRSQARTIVTQRRMIARKADGVKCREGVQRKDALT